MSRNKVRLKVFTKKEYNRILKAFKNYWKYESSQFKHRITKKRNISMVYDEDGDSYLEDDSKFHKKTIRNPNVETEDVIDALYEIHHEDRIHENLCF